jgi:hypothetical protein
MLVAVDARGERDNDAFVEVVRRSSAFVNESFMLKGGGCERAIW